MFQCIIILKTDIHTQENGGESAEIISQNKQIILYCRHITKQTSPNTKVIASDLHMSALRNNKLCFGKIMKSICKYKGV